MAAYLPQVWPERVRPPGSEDLEASAVAFPVKLICSAWSGRIGQGRSPSWESGRRRAVTMQVRPLSRGPNPGQEPVIRRWVLSRGL
jgi:hypothetical protein